MSNPFKKEIVNNSQKSSSFKKKEYSFSEETILSLNELGSIFEKIHKRLVSEGYIIKNNKILKPKSV